MSVLCKLHYGNEDKAPASGAAERVASTMEDGNELQRRGFEEAPQWLEPAQI